MRGRPAKRTQLQKNNPAKVKVAKEEKVAEVAEPEVEEPAIQEEENGQEDSDDNDAAADGQQVDTGSDDEAAVEEPIGKVEPTIPSKVKTGQISADYPHERVVHVNKLPKSSKFLDVVEIFAKYGPIDQIHFHQGPVDNIANVAFKTAGAAKAALGAHKQHTIDGSTILVTMKRATKKKPKNTPATDDSRERCVYVKSIKRGTTEDQLREHFASYGEIEKVHIITKNSIQFGFVTFAEKEAVDKALELHNTLLNGANIGVFRNRTDASDRLESRNPELTVILRNKQELESVEGQKLESIFSECGEITNMDVLCKKKVLAFITFKTEEGKLKALELNGQTVDEIDIQIDVYNPDALKKSIFIINVAHDTTEADIKSHFAKAGETSAVILRKGFAIVHFMETEGYCKSFLLNETILNGQMIFLEPYSVKKQNVMKNKQNYGVKRRFSNGKGGFPAKRAKII